jgi:hypothetical protein
VCYAPLPPSSSSLADFIATRRGWVSILSQSFFFFLSETRLPPPLAVIIVSRGRPWNPEDGAWCVCRSDLADSALQKTLDYACGGGADCKPILQGGACFAPDTVKAHCSYAANSFYQRNGQNAQACVFSGTAALSNVDPSESTARARARARAARFSDARLGFLPDAAF